MHRSARRATGLATAVVLALLSSCAPMRPQPDRAARAPELPGFGAVQVPITTTSPSAQRLFTQGVLQAYAFNEVEAVRMFKAALAQDPACAACAWGVAWQLGPNINSPGRAGAQEALRYVDHAVRHAAGATPREKALIDAMAIRYGHASQARETAPLLDGRCGPGKGKSDGDKAHPLDIAYAARLRQMADAAPQDAEIVALYAEAEMVATRADWWSDAGKPGGRIGEVAAMLEAALAVHPGHVGLNHYLIHAVDAPTEARRAIAAADRMGALAPAAPHLLHMPSHIYIRIGRYADAAQVNEAAVAADLALFELLKTQGFEITKDWRNHDQHFLWYAALMQGRGDVALQAARGVAERAAGADHDYGEYLRSLPALALLRLGRWDALLVEPLPSGGHGIAQVLGAHARGVAQVRKGLLAAAQASLARADAGAAAVAKARSGTDGFDAALREMAAAAADRLRAEIALAQGRPDDALALQAKAVASSAKADDSEPPMLAAGARLALAEMQLRAGRPALAEATYRADLAALPDSGWALQGLAKALQAQGRGEEAKAVQAPLASAWAQADAALRAPP